MALNFDVTTTLPNLGCTEQNVYDTIETINPTSVLVEGTGLQILDNKIALANGVSYWRKITKLYSDFSTGSTVNDIQGINLAAGGILHAIKLKHSTAFSGGAIASYTISVGISGTLNKYMAAKSVFTAVSSTNFCISWAPLFNSQFNTFGNTDNEISGLTISAAYSQSEIQALRTAAEELADDTRALKAALIALSAGTVGSESHTAATSIRLTATSTGANLDAATAGSVDVWFNYSVVT